MVQETADTRDRRGGTFWSFLSRLLFRPSPASEATGDTRHDKAPPNKIPDHADIDEVRRNLAVLLDGDQSVSGAHIRVIGLHALKQKVGDDWPKFHRIIHMAVENVLARALSKSDRYLRIGDDLYLIAYAKTDAENATKRTDAIAAALLKHLLGTQREVPISIHAISGRINVSDGGGLSFDPVDASQSVPEPTDVVAEDVGWREQPKATIRVPVSPKREMELALEKAKETAQRLSEVNVELGYAPIWDAKKNIVSTYAVLPYRALGSSFAYEHQALGPIPSEGALLALDVRCLRHGITDIAKLYSNGERSLVCVQIKYSSLLSKTGMRKILEEASRVPDFLRKYLSIVIVGVPADFQLGTCSRIISMLRQHFRFIVLRAPSINSQLDDLSRLGMDVVAASLPEKDGLSPTVRAQIERLVSQSVTHRIALTIEYIPTIAAAREIQAIGVPYLSGHFLGPLLQAPAGVRPYGLSDLPLAAS